MGAGGLFGNVDDPDRPTGLLGALRRLLRLASWPCALLVGGWVAWSMQPLTAPDLLNYTRALQFSLYFADVYSELHEQPFAYCDTYFSQRDEALKRVAARVKELPARGLSSIVAVVREYSSIMRDHYEGDCRSPWRPYQNPANFQKVFACDYPLFYMISELDLTEVHLALLQVVAGWSGVVSIALLSVYFWRSPLAPVVSLAVTSMLLRRSFATSMGAALPGDATLVDATLVAVPNKYLYPAVTVLLIIAMLQPILRRTGSAVSKPITVLLALVYGSHAMLYYVVDPPVARMFAIVGAAYVVCAGLVFRRWQVVVTGALAGLVQLTLDGVFRAPGSEIYSAVTRTNHLASEAFNSIMVYMGFLERPSPFGLFYMDEVFAWLNDQDPVLVRMAPHMVVHHSYAHSGSALMWQAFATEPFTVLDAVFRRVLIQILHRSLWFLFVLRIDWVYTLTIVSMLVLNLWAIVRSPVFLFVTPMTLCILVNQFAVNTVMTLVHNHARWNQLGVLLMFALAPLYVYSAARLLASLTGKWPDWRGAAAELTARPVKAAAAASGVAAAVWLGQLAVATVREERQFVDVWATVHRPPPGGVDIIPVVDRLESLRTSTGDKHGEIAMWIASILKMYQSRYTSLPADRVKRVNDLRNAYYRLALAAAPDSPHFLFAARFLAIEDWESYLLQGLQQFPDSIYAPGAAAALRFSGRESAPPGQAERIELYDRHTSRFLAGVGSWVPGFDRIPVLAPARSGSVSARTRKGPDGITGLRLTLAPGAEASLAIKPTYGSFLAMLVAYIDVQDGAVEAAMALRAEGHEPRLAASRILTKDSRPTLGRYQFFDARAEPGETGFGLLLKAGKDGATVNVRDYYPIVDHPKHYYRSALMDRVKARAASRQSVRSDAGQP
jgi:hypothetical protein